MCASPNKVIRFGVVRVAIVTKVIRLAILQDQILCFFSSEYTRSIVETLGGLG